MFKNMGNSFLSKRRIFRTLIIHYIFTKRCIEVAIKMQDVWFEAKRHKNKLQVANLQYCKADLKALGIQGR